MRILLDARQMGISLVCLLGPGFSLSCLRTCRYRICQRTTLASCSSISSNIPMDKSLPMNGNFPTLNPPVQAWAALATLSIWKKKKRERRPRFLERCFHKLLMNFSWWVNQVDSSGNNVFEGGFLGMDNISILDRSQRLSWRGQHSQQSDGTGWMALFCLNLMRIALELAKTK